MLRFNVAFFASLCFALLVALLAGAFGLDTAKQIAAGILTLCGVFLTFTFAHLRT